MKVINLLIIPHILNMYFKLNKQLILSFNNVQNFITSTIMKQKGHKSEIQREDNISHIHTYNNK